MMLALGASVVGAAAYGGGSVLQARAAQRAVGSAVLRHPDYLAGVGCDLLGFVAALVAVRSLPLFAVQSILAGSLAVVVVLARVVLGTPIRRRDTVLMLALVGALVVLALGAGTQSAHLPPGWFTPVALVAAAAAGVCLAGGYRRADATALAVLAGGSFAGSAICARALVLDGSLFTIALHPVAWMVAAFGLIGTVAYARCLERGSVGPATAIVWVVEVLVAGGFGVLALGDRVLSGWEVPVLAAMCVAILGCVVLAGAQPE